MGVRTVGVSEREGEGEVKGFWWLASGVMGVLLGGSSSPIGGLEWRAGEREGVGQSLQRLPRAPLLLCVQAQKDKENKREREGWPARVNSWSVCKERGKKREEKKKKWGLWPKFD
jgi:hypothetical protein